MNMEKSILILGGSHSEIPLIKAAKPLGLSISTTGNRPEQIGHLFSDKYFHGDFSNFDEMLSVAKRSKCDFICAGANDYSYLSACYVAEKLNLSGFDSLETAFAIHHKHLFKPIASNLGLPTTNFRVIDLSRHLELDNLQLNLPLMIKPVDLTGGKGIVKVNQLTELKPALIAIRDVSKEKFAIVEEYFEGSLHSYSTIIVDGRVVFQYADNEYCYPNPYLVSASTSLASVPIDVLQDLQFQTEKFAKFLKLKNGVLHCQFLYGNGDYKILEFTRRCSGDLYSSVVQAVTGLNHPQQFIRQSMGIEFNLNRDQVISHFVSRHCIFSDNSGTYHGLEIAKELENNLVFQIESFANGYHIKQPHKEKMGVVILKFASHSEMLEKVSCSFNFVKCLVQ